MPFSSRIDHFPASLSLTESEERYRTLADSISDIIWTTNAEGLMEGEQPGWAKFTGQTFSQYQGLGWLQVIHPEDAKPTIEAWKKAVAKRCPFLFEHRIRNVHGEYRHCSVRAVPIIGENEIVREWIGVHTDLTEKRAAQAALQESESRRLLALEAAGIGEWDLDLQTHVCQRSPKYDEIFGYSVALQHWTHETLISHIHPDDRRLAIDVFDLAIKEGQPLNWEGRIIRPDNSVRWIWLSGHCLTDAQQEPSRMVGIVHDITQRKSADAAVRFSEARFRRIFENPVQPIFIMDGDWLVDANSAGLALLGYSKEEFHSRQVNWRKQTPPGYEEVDDEMYHKFLAAGSTRVFTKDFLRKDGSRVPVEISAASFGGLGPVGMIFMTDISARRAFEQELIAKERHLRLAQESTGLGTWEDNLLTGTSSWSSRTRAIFGYPKDAPIDPKWFTQFVSADDFEKIVHSMSEACDPEHGCFEVEYQFLKYGTDKRWIRATGMGIFAERSNGSRICESVLGSVLDITDLKRTEQIHAAALMEARRASEAKDEFLAKLSHELRTPLTPVLMVAGALLEEGVEDAQLKEDLEMIYRNVEVEARLIDDLLDVTRITNQKLELNKSACDLNQIIRHALEVCQGSIDSHGLSVCFETDAPNSWVQGEAARLQQVFWNLINNACKFTPGGGQILIKTSNPSADSISVAVIDNGMGIDASKIGTLFTAFEQGDRSVTQRFGGLGLGLSICQGIVKLHHGSLRAFSDGSGMGATFEVTLPCLLV